MEDQKKSKDPEELLTVKEFAQLGGTSKSRDRGLYFETQNLWEDKEGIYATKDYSEVEPINLRMIRRFNTDYYFNSKYSALFENFSEYELLSTLPMQSSYSIRIYELLKSYAFTKSHVFDIADLKRQLSCEHYERFPDFRRKVIEIAVRDINLYTDLEVSWEPIKDGRKITQIRVYIKTKETFERIQAQYKAIDQIEGQMDIEDYYK